MNKMIDRLKYFHGQMLAMAVGVGVLVHSSFAEFDRWMIIINHLKSHGVVCAPSAIDGINNHMSDLFYLKRVNVNILED